MTEPYRYRCPNGHVSWRSCNSWQKESKADYYCNTCQQNWENPHFDELVDVKT